jgi:uncharacterized membrane protein
MAAPNFDYLDSMMWSIAASGLMVGIAALRLHYKASSDSFEEEGKNVRTGLGMALGLAGFYLFLTGISISFKWPFTSSGGIYNILFGGSAALAGLVLLATSAAFLLGRGLQGASYLALLTGIYLLVDAYSIFTYSTGGVKVTSDPMLSTLVFLAPAAPLILSVPATHTDNKWLRWLFAIFAFLFGIAWLYMAAKTTYGHLAPPPPTP